MPLTVVLGGKVQVTCIHGREKRKTKELAYDVAKHKPQVCPCCENLFLTTTDEPTRCIMCKPREVLHG